VEVPFACTVGIFLLAFHGLAYSLFRWWVVDRLSLWQAASAPEALGVNFLGVVVVLPVIIGYTVVAYRVFGAKSTASRHWRRPGWLRRLGSTCQRPRVAVRFLPPQVRKMRITSKGQVTIPQSIRAQAGLHPHSEVAFELRANGDVVIRSVVGAPKSLRSAFERVRGSANATQFKGMGTDEFIAFLRG